MKRLFAAALIATAGGLLAIAGGASAQENFKWLCKPGLKNDPCMTSLKSTVVSPTGSTRVINPKRQSKPSVDCFYVYPTVSSQPGPNASLATDPEVYEIARQQAAQFSRNCRVFAPVYPQYTVLSIATGTITPDAIETAYAGVKSAWLEYLKKHNHGRGIVLIGHSQGTGHLGRLIEETFDRKPNLRKRLVSATLIGGNLYVPKGKLVGGQFRKVPACSKTGQFGCIIASSSFSHEPPADAAFGRVTGALVAAGLDPDRYEVICVNPAALDRNRKILKPRYTTGRFPGINGNLAPVFFDGVTPFASFPNLYRAGCRRANGARWLQVDDISTPADTRVRHTEGLGPTWGTHLSEMSDQMGNLVSVVKRQTNAYLKKVRKQKKKSRQKAN
ncbi:MAG: DUF3089 domain-containing protein [Solirubrobacterales bacterium]